MLRMAKVLAEEFLKEMEFDDSPEFVKSNQLSAQRIRSAKTHHSIVTGFMMASWDLPTFSHFIQDLLKRKKINGKDAAMLLGDAAVREREWDT